jgi:hypothetical protein
MKTEVNRKDRSKSILLRKIDAGLGKNKVFSFLLSLIFCLFFLVNVFAQVSYPTHFQNQFDTVSNKESFFLGLPDNTMLMLWYERGNSAIQTAKSYDGGLSWDYSQYIVWFTEENPVDINAIVLNAGRILVAFKNTKYKAIYSDNNGETWSEPYELPTLGVLSRYKVANTSLSMLSDGTAVFVFSYQLSPSSPSQKIYTISSSDGINWSENQLIDSLGNNGNIVGINSNNIMLVYETYGNPNKDIVYRTSSDGGINWSDQQILLSDAYNKFKPRIIKDNTDKLWLLYYRSDPTVFQGYSQNEIYFTTSTDQGLSWTVPDKFSDYAGEDELSSLSIWNGSPIVSFGSTRNQNFQDSFYQIYYGFPETNSDVSTPPYLYDFSILPPQPEENEPITFRVLADDEISLYSVKAFIDNNGSIDSLDMYDDGEHNDSLPGDNIYGAVIENGFPNGTMLIYDFLLTDVDNNTAGFKGSYVAIPNLVYLNTYLVEDNKLKLPLNNHGVLANVEDTTQGLHFDESSVLFSGGFYLSGYYQNEVWTNAVASASLVEDYLPGPVGSIPNDFRNSLYIIKSSDLPFDQSWNGYRYAVELGADFYDGDEDGIYNPVDLNGNDIWDSNEDRPDFLGDVTAWCVYNDSKPAPQRRWNAVTPKGIEIQQTLFAIGNESNPIDNMIFIRYRIINKGTISSQFDSVYFGLWEDPDIGGFVDDLAGCDTTLNLGYSYNDGIDESYGTNPPSFGSQILSGPVVYIPGETFIDNNGNNIYDEGIDTPIDTALVNKGEILGAEYYPGAKNLGVSSFIHYMNGNPNMNDPSNHIEARNYMLGRNRVGDVINPCNWQYGYVSGVPCDQVNPLFLYSGDPTIPYGWINADAEDQRTLTNTGPFTLKQNENVDIWTAYVVGRGNNALESVTKMKAYSLGAKSFYESNFTELPSDLKQDKGINTPVTYSLSQNYPNPFNPATTINYQLPERSQVTIKVFDILGREVATLVNEEKPAGKYNVEFNASDLSSGVYFYQLKTNLFIQTKKMLLIK